MQKHLTMLFALLLLSITVTRAQSEQKCGTMDVYYQAIQKNPAILDKERQLEETTNQFLQQRNLSSTSNTVLTIPVVIHIIHNGEPIGTGSNISDAQAISQIDLLNDDFRKRNADSLDTSHPFYSVSADCEIEFCLAKQDEDGNPTTGITRYDGESTFWETDSFDETIKPVTIWDRTKYMNLWSTKFGGANDDLDGYGTFPAEANDSTDGVVVQYTSFGRINGVKSIIATHEVGHYLNLRHIWGDNEPNCGDDLVADTPPSTKPNYGCPVFPLNPNNSCGTDANGEMFMNYMDYSDDDCVVMFTNGQKDRMQATLATSRASLISSMACNELVGVKEVFAENNFSVLPNPNTGRFIIDTDLKNTGKMGISLFNQLGASIEQFNKVNQFPLEVNFSDLPNGVYFIKISNDSNTLTKKVIIVN